MRPWLAPCCWWVSGCDLVRGFCPTTNAAAVRDSPVTQISSTPRDRQSVRRALLVGSTPRLRGARITAGLSLRHGLVRCTIKATPTSQRRIPMQYAVLIYDEPDAYESLSPTELERVKAEYGPITADPAARRCAASAGCTPRRPSAFLTGLAGTDGPSRPPRRCSRLLPDRRAGLDAALAFAARIRPRGWVGRSRCARSWQR